MFVMEFVDQAKAPCAIRVGMKHFVESSSVSDFYVFFTPPLRFLEFVATLSFNWIQFVGQGKATCAMRDRGLPIPPGLRGGGWLSINPKVLTQ